MSWKARDGTRFAKTVTGLPSKADSNCTPWHQKSTALSAEPRDTPSMRCKYGLIWFDIISYIRIKTKDIYNEHQRMTIQGHSIDTINNFNWNAGIRKTPKMIPGFHLLLIYIYIFVYSLFILFHIPHLRQRSVGRLSFRDLFAPLPSLPQIPEPGVGWSRQSPGHSGTKWFSTPSMFRPNFNLFHCFGLAVSAIIKYRKHKGNSLMNKI